MQSFFSHVYCNGVILQPDNTNRDVHIKGTVTETVKENKIYYAAASPPDYRATFTGSGLPFANPSQAFENTPNIGSIILQKNKFELSITFPNSYYTNLGTVYHPPTIYFFYKNENGIDRIIDVKISQGIPFRTLTYPNERNCASFYDADLPVRSQEEILKSSAYPSINKQPENFWGLRPPH